MLGYIVYTSNMAIQRRNIRCIATYTIYMAVPQFVGVEAFCTTLVDLWPKLLRRGYRRELLFGVTSAVMFLCGLPMVTYVSNPGVMVL